MPEQDTDKPPPLDSGIKYDAVKYRWSLFPAGTLVEVLGVLEHGARKYAPENWRMVPDARVRYYNAIMRHMEQWREGNGRDPDSGFCTMAHVICSALFILYFDMKASPE